MGGGGGGRHPQASPQGDFIANITAQKVRSCYRTGDNADAFSYQHGACPCGFAAALKHSAVIGTVGPRGAPCCSTVYVNTGRGIFQYIKALKSRHKNYFEVHNQARPLGKRRPRPGAFPAQDRFLVLLVFWKFHSYPRLTSKTSTRLRSNSSQGSPLWLLMSIQNI